MRRFLQTAILSLLCTLAGAEGTIVRIVPIASDDNVKLEITLDKDTDVYSLQASIEACRDASVLWHGSLGSLGTKTNDTTFVCRINDLKPQLWSTVDPVLYKLTVNSSGGSCQVRLGFRRFEMRDGRFYLNGKPIFLRGNAINPPGRGIPEELEASKEFARDYVRFLKGMNINMIRIPDNQNWMDVCDEEGMMIFGGRYGRPVGGTESEPPKDLDASVRMYKEQDLGAFTPHPSVMIYVLSNETPYKGAAGDKWREFLRQAYDRLKEWDHTRQYICNAGYGLGRSADVYDVHRYWGWYYNSFLTYLNLRDMAMWQNEGKVQAVTFTECVGNYTGIDGSFNLCSRTKQPGSQKCWTGHLPPEQQASEALEYQAFVLKNATEMFRRFRAVNPCLSGVMPFTIMFFNWDGVSSFAQMGAKPAAYQYQESYQPVLLSWENWQYNAKSGGVLHPVCHIVNDDDLCRDLVGARVEWVVENARRSVIASGGFDLPDVSYYGTFSRQIEIPLPEEIYEEECVLRGTVIGADGEVVSVNKVPFFMAGESWVKSSLSAAGAPVLLYDRDGSTSAAFGKLGISFKTVTSLEKLPSKSTLVLGEDSWDAYISAHTEMLRRFASRGGRILCLRQNPSSFDYSWIDAGIAPLSVSNNDPTYLSAEYEYVDGMNINIEDRSHPVFEGISQKNLRLWADYTGFRESQDKGFPAVYPVTAGFLARKVDLQNARILADYTRNLSAAALAEFGLGKGSVILSGFDLARRAGVDPVAEKMLLNMVRYAASSAPFDPYRKVGSVIEWGDYASENGLVTGAVNGLVVNPYPVVPVNRRDEYPLEVDDRGYHYVVSYGGWNIRPGVQYVPHGRRPFAPFNYTLGGNDTLEKGAEACGEGYFVAKAPEGSSKMKTTFENNAGDPITVSVTVNDSPANTYTIEPHSQIVAVDVLPSDGRIRVTIKGDRRTVILRTAFE